MNRWLFVWGAVLTLIGLETYLSEYYTLSRCYLDWCPTGSQLHPEMLLLVPLGLIVIGYSLRRRGEIWPWNSSPVRVQASKALPIAIVIAIVLSGTAWTSLSVASAEAGSLCARELPSGSIVNPATGTIALPNGSIIAAADFPCTMTSVVWQNTMIGNIGPYASVALFALATILLVYFVARKRAMPDAGPSPPTLKAH